MRNARVLVVEDEGLVRLGIRHALRKHGYRVLEAQDATEALSVWQRESGAIDLVIADLFLPTGSAIELAETLRRGGQSVPFVYVSAHPANLVRSRGWLGSGEAFLQKPFAHEDLIALVRSKLAL